MAASRKGCSPQQHKAAEERWVSQQGWQQSQPLQILRDGLAEKCRDRTQLNSSQSIVKGQQPMLECHSRGIIYYGKIL